MAGNIIFPRRLVREPDAIQKLQLLALKMTYLHGLLSSFLQQVTVSRHLTFSDMSGLRKVTLVDSNNGFKEDYQSEVKASEIVVADMLSKEQRDVVDLVSQDIELH